MQRHKKKVTCSNRSGNKSLIDYARKFSKSAFQTRLASHLSI